MMLVALIGVPLIVGILTLLIERWSRFLSLLCLIANLAIGLLVFGQSGVAIAAPPHGSWWEIWQMPWILEWGIQFDFRIDGLSFILIMLTNVMGILAVWCSWRTVHRRVAFFHFCLLTIVSGMIGIFLACDLFVFFVFWEVMLIPLYFVILLSGHDNRIFSSVQFLIFTQASGLLLLLSLLGLYFAHYSATGELTFAYDVLMNTDLSSNAEFFIVCGFLVAFLVKLAVFPVHVWLPDLFTSAPTGALLVGVLVKSGAYGMLRFVIPMFPEVSSDLSPIMMGLGAVSLVFGAVLAFGQTDVRRLFAYSTVSHMGLILIGVFSLNEAAAQGVVVLLVTQALSTGALLVLFNKLQHDGLAMQLGQASGLMKTIPKTGVIAMFLVMASIGLPGLGNFVGEYLVLYGAFSQNQPTAVIAAFGLVLGAIYSLWLLQKFFFGERVGPSNVVDLTVANRLVYVSVIVALVIVGLFPKPMLDIFNAPSTLQVLGENP